MASCHKENFNSSHRGTGKSGSMARFIIVGDQLYVIDNASLKVFDISSANDPEYVKEIGVGTDIETIFSHSNYLYIGSEMGIYIYDISDPLSPQYLSKLLHILSCDPVVTNDTLAFVTLFGGGDCRNNNSSISQLDIIDIKNKENPQLLISHQLDSPLGLALDENYLFLCQGEYGFSVFDFSDIETLNLIYKNEDHHCYDVITNNKNLLIIGSDGLYQYDYQQIDSIYFISKINIER
jgi:hypothetical protein